MNHRQKMKQLKRNIERLKSDNRLMRDIIDNSPRMAELYDLYNRPVNVTTTTMRFERFKSTRFLPPNNPQSSIFTEIARQGVERELIETIKNYIKFEICNKDTHPSIEGSIFIGIGGKDK